MGAVKVEPVSLQPIRIKVLPNTPLHPDSSKFTGRNQPSR